MTLHWNLLPSFLVHPSELSLSGASPVALESRTDLKMDNDIIDISYKEEYNGSRITKRAKVVLQSGYIRVR